MVSACNDGLAASNSRASARSGVGLSPAAIRIAGDRTPHPSVSARTEMHDRIPFSAIGAKGVHQHGAAHETVRQHDHRPRSLLEMLEMLEMLDAKCACAGDRQPWLAYGRKEAASIYPKASTLMNFDAMCYDLHRKA
jgi:hypothetical protein